MSIKSKLIGYKNASYIITDVLDNYVIAHNNYEYVVWRWDWNFDKDHNPQPAFYSGYYCLTYVDAIKNIFFRMNEFYSFNN